MRALWLALMAGMVAGSADAQTRTPSDQVPVEQLNLVTAVTTAKERQAKAATDFQRGAVRPARGREICAFLKNRTVSGWIGEVTMLTTNSDGNGVITINVGGDVSISTWNNALSDIGSNTLIKPETALFQALGNLRVGDLVIFSGSFFQNKVDCIQESSLTLDGSIDSPRYIFRFKNIELY